MKKYFILIVLVGLGFFLNAQNTPTASDNTVTTNEDIDYNFVESDFGYNDIDGDAFYQIQVTSTTSTGTLYLDANTDGIVDGGEAIGNNTNVLVTDFNNLKFKPLSNQSGANYDSFNFRVDDNKDGLSVATYTMTIDVTAVNDAPVVTTNTGKTVNEGATNQVIAQAELETTDIEQNANNLTYTVTSGPSNGTLNLMSFTQADINSGNVNYTHNGTETTSDAFNFTVDDGTGTATSSVNGTFNITITAVNDAPTAADNTLSCNENSLLIFSTANFNYDDEEDNAGNPNGPFIKLEVTTIPDPLKGIVWVDADGSGDVNGGELALTAGAVVTTIDINNGFFKYMPNANYNGADSYTFKVHDGLVYSAVAYTMDINVNSVNSEPYFTKGVDVSCNEDAPAQTIAGWATNISAGAPDEAGQTLTFVLDNYNTSLFSVQPAVDPATGNLTFTPAANANGTTTVRIMLTDDGGLPEDDTSPYQFFDITINAVNDPPTAADNSKNCQENSFVTFLESDFGYNDIEGDAFDQLKITTAPGPGVLWVDTDLDGTINGGEAQLVNGNVVTLSNMVSPDRLRFMPDSDENGAPYTTFDFRVYDGTDFSVATYTMTINVAPINSEPSFDKGADIVVNEDAGAQSFGAWATNIDDGDIELAQNLTFFLSTAQNALFSTQPAVDPATGNLTFTPAANANGVATVNIYLQDDGSGVAPNDNTSPTQTFTITITPINDPIQLDQNNPLTVDEGASGIISNLLLQYSDLADGTPTSSIVYTVTALPTHGTLYIGVTPIPLNGTFTQQQIDANSISYTNDGTESITDAFNFTVTDGDTNVASVFNININPLNDNPYFTSSPVITGTEGALYTYNITAADNDNVGADLSFTDSSAPALPAWLVLTDNGDGTASLSGTPPFGSPASINICITVDDGVAPTSGSSQQCYTLSLTNGVTVDAGADDTTCDDTYTLNGSQPPAGYYGVWTNPSGGATIANVNQYNTLVTNLNRGDGIANQNSFRWTIYRNSDNTEVMFDEVTISNNAVTATIIPPAGDVCGDVSTLNAMPLVYTEESGTWTVNGTPVPAPVIVTPNNNVSAVTGLNNNTNDFTWTVTKGTCSDTDILSINRIEVFATASADAEICSEPFIVYGNDPAPLGGTGVWTVGAGGGTFANANAPTTTVTGAHQDVINTYVWTVTVNGCSAQSSVDVQNNTPSSAVITTSYPATVSCDGNATISAVPADASDPNETGFWTSATAGVIIANANNATTAVSNLQEGANLFTWHITNGTCPEETADVTINYFHPPTVNAGPDATICSDVYNLAATALEAGETGVWTQSTGSSNILNPNSNTTQVTNLQRGINIFQWTVNHDICSSTDLVTITNMNVEAIISTSSPLISCTDPSPLVTANSAASQNIANPSTSANGFWTVESGGGVITSPSSNLTTFSNLDSGNNNFIWHISNGICTDADTITVINSIPTQAYAGLDTIICSTTLNNLNGNNYDNTREIGFWRVVAGGATITTPSLANTSVTNLDYYCTDWTPDWWNNVNTANVFEWVIRRGTCESTDQVQVLNGIPGVIDAGIDQTVCDNIVNLDALDEGSCAQDHWWEAIPTTGVVFYDPFDGSVDNTDFNAHVDPIQAGMTQFVWHKRNSYTDSQGNPIVCTLTDTVQITSLGMEEDVDAGQNKAVCATDWLLNATPPASVIAHSAFSSNVTGQWSVTFGNGNFDDDTYYNTTVRNMGYYTNVYRWTITDHDNGCDMSDDVYIHNGLPSNAQTGPDREICDDNAVISANNPDRADAQWWEMITGSGIITGSACGNIFCTAQVNNMSPGVNTFVWHVIEEYPSGTEWIGPIAPYTAANQLVCELTDTLRITNNGVTANAGNTIYICADTAQLNAVVPIGTTGQWLANSGSFASTGGLTTSLYNDVALGLTRGKNSFRWTITNGYCSDTDDLVVWDNLPAPNPNAGADQVICEDSTILTSNSITRNNTWYNLNGNLTQEGYSTQEWTVGLGTGTFDASSTTNTWVRNVGIGDNEYLWNAYYHFTDYRYEVVPGSGVYSTWTQTCSLTDTVNIYNNAVTSNAGADPGVVCGVEGPGATYNLNALAVSLPATGLWTPVFAPGATIVDPTAFNTLVTGMQNGDHVYRWTVSSTYNGKTCSANDDVIIEVRIPTTAVVGTPSTYEICEDFTTVRANNPTLGFGTWTEIPVASGIIDSPSSNNTLVTGIGLGQRQFQWTIDNDGCTSSDIMTVNNNMVTSDADDRIGQDAILHGVAANDTAICQDTYILSATDPNIYNTGAAPFPTGSWLTQPAFPGTVTFDDPTAYNTTVRNLSNTGTKISNLFWTITKGGCTEVSRLDITDNEFIIDADVNTNPNLLETCDGDILLAGEQVGTLGNPTGVWSVFSGGGTIQISSLYNTTVTGVPIPNSVYKWTVTRFGCVATDVVQVDNNTVSANAGFDQTVCVDNVTLNAGVPQAGETGQWTVPFGGSTVTDQTAFDSGVTNLAQGPNTFRWTITKGNCNDFDEVDVINNEPSDFNVEANREVCTVNDAITVNPGAIGTGIWSISQGGAFTTVSVPTAPNTNVTDLQPGLNTFVWTATNGACTKTGSVTLTNNMVISNAGIPQFVCADSVVLAADNPAVNFPFQGTGLWTNITAPGNIVDATAFNTKVINLIPGLNQFRWTMSLGTCSENTVADVTNNAVEANASNQTVCTDFATFDGNNPGAANGLWSLVGSSGTPIITNSILNISTVTDLGFGTNTFQWLVGNAAGCKDSIEIYIDNQSFTTSAGSDQLNLCSTSSVLAGQDHGVGFSGEWHVIAGGATVTNSTQYNSPVTGLTPGDNVFRWVVTNSASCSANDEVILRNNLPTTALIVDPLPANRELCVNFATVEGTNPSYGTGEWTVSTSPTGAYFTNSTNHQTVINNLYPGDNVITWTITNGACVSTDQITITNNEVVAVAGTDQTVCDDNTFLNATDPSINYPNQGVGTWVNTTGNAAIVVTPSLETTQVTSLPIGTTTFTWTVSKGICSEPDDVLITNSTVTAVATSQSLCSEDFTLNGNDPSTFTNGSGYWEIVGGSGTIVAPSTQFDTDIIGVVNGGTTTLRWNVTNVTCSDDIEISVTNNNFNVEAGATQDICSNSTTLNGDDPLTGVGTWSMISGSANFGNINSNSTTVGNIAQGTNTYRWTIVRDGCTNSDDVIVNNNSPSLAQITGPLVGAREVCDGTVTLLANNPSPLYADSHYWKLVSGNATFVTNSTGFNVNITDLAPGDNIFRWTIERGACPASTDDITITNNEVVSVAGTDQILCSDNTFLNGTDPTTIYPNQGVGHWTNLSGANGAVIANSLLNNTLVSNLPLGSTSFQWSVSRGTCTADSIVVITNNSVSAIATDQSSCSENFTLNGNDPSTFGGTGYWEIVGGSGTIVAPSTQFNTNINGVVSGGTTTLRWNVSNAYCSDDIEISVTNNNFNVSAGANQTVCSNYTVLNADDPLTGIGTWTLVAGAGTFDNSNSNTATVSGLNQAINQFRWTITRDGCTNSEVVNITNNSPSTALITGPLVGFREVCDGTVTLLANNPSPLYADSHYWKLVSGNATFVTNSTGFNVDITDLAPGDNIFRWTIERGACPASIDDITITNNEVVSVAGTDQILCSDNTFLNATDPTTIYPNQGVGHWTNLSGANGAIIANSLLNNTLVSNLPLGSTSFQWSVSRGTCTADSIVVITNNSVSAIATDQSLCSEDFTLNGNNPSTFGGTGYWEIIGGSGTIVAPSTQFNTNINGIVNGGTTTLRWNVTNVTCSDDIEISVTNNNFNVSAGANQTVCSNSTVLNADDPLTGVGTWTLVAGAGTFDNSNSNTATVSGLNQALNQFRWTITRDGCTNSEVVNITNNSPSTALITGPLVSAREVCDGKITLTANQPAPLYADAQYWELVSGNATFLTSTTGFSVDISDLAPGDNKFRWTIERGACVPSTDIITIVNNEVHANAGTDQYICTNSANLGAGVPIHGTGVWTFEGSGLPTPIIDNSLSNMSSVTNLQGGLNTFKWTVIAGICETSANVQIFDNSVEAIALYDTTCSNTVQLTGNDPSLFVLPTTGSWTSFTAGVIFDDSNVYNTDAHNLVSGNNTFVWTLDNGYCTDDANIKINYIDPIADAGPMQNLCSDGTFLNAQDPSQGTHLGIGTWTATTGNGTFVDINDPNTFVSDIGIGLNVYTWTVVENICTEVSSVTINNNLPNASAGTDMTTCLDYAIMPASQEQVTETAYWTKIGGNGIVTNSTQYNSPVTNLSPGINTFRWTVENGTCSNTDEVTIFNNKITSINAGLDQNTCSNTITLSALTPGIGETGQWNNVSGSAIFDNSALFNTDVTNLSLGINLLSWTISNGTCDSTDFVNIINNSPAIPITDPDQEICTSILTVNVTAPGVGETGIWTNEFGAQGTIVDPTINTTAIHSIGPGANTFRWTVSNALCNASDDIVITNNRITTDAGLDQSRCEDTTVLAANNPGLANGWWELVNPTTGPILDNSAQYNTVVRNLSKGSNTFKWTVTNGSCSDWDLVTISNDLPSIADAGLDQIVCDGNATLAANNPTVGTGVWSRLGGAGVIANASHYNTSVTGLGSGGNTFRWEITQSSCSSYDDIFIMNELVFASAGQDEQICGDSYSELNGNQPGVGETGEWTVLGGSGVFADPTLYNTSVSGLSGGENRLVWTVYRGTCDNSDEVIIRDDTPSQPTVSSDQETCNDYIVISGNPPITGVGHWSVEAGSGIFDDTAANTTTVRQIGKNNTYRWTITKGLCENFADVNIVNNSVSAVVGDTIKVCGSDTYLNGNEPNTGETGTWTVTAGDGIIANSTQYNTPVSNLTVGLNKFRWTISNGNCPDYADLVVINNLYAANASVAGPTTICQDFANIQGNIPVQGSSGHWEVFAGRGIFDNSENPSTLVSELNKGQNTLRWFITKEGCTAYADISITNNMVVAKAGVDIITCGNDANLSANDLLDSETGLWTLVAGSGTILTPSNNETVITGQSSGVNVFKWTVWGNGCTDNDDVQINENSFNIEAGPTQTVCSTDASLAGENPSPGTGIWTTGSGVIINNLTNYVTTVSGLHDNSPHTFRWTVIKNGCTAWDEVIVNNHLVHANAGDDNTTCSSNITLHATQPIAGSGVWSFNQGSGVITTPSNNETTVTGLSLGQSTLTWTVSHSNCTDADNVIVINNTVTATAGINQAICDNTTNLAGTPPQAGGYGIWEVIGGPGIVETESAYNTLVTNLQRGTNTFRWTVYENGCDNHGSNVQVVNNTFDADAGLDQTLAALDTDTYFDAELLANQSGQWSIFSGSGDILDDTNKNSFVENMPTGENIFSWTVHNNLTGCYDSDEVSIIVANFEPYAGEDSIICQNFYNLNARIEPGATSHTWSIVSGAGAFDDVHDANTVVRNINHGMNIYRWTVTFVGYSAHDDVIITNDSIFVTAGDDVSTCETYHTMNAGRLAGAVSTNWTPVGFGGGGIIADNSAWNTLVTELAAGPSSFEWFVDNGHCVSRDTVVITYKLPPIAQFETDFTEFCAPQVVTINNTSTAYGGQSQPDEFHWLIEDFALAPTYDVNTDIVHNFTNTAEWDSIYHIRLVAIDYETMCTDTFISNLTAYAAPNVIFEIKPDQARIPDADFQFSNESDTTLNEYQWDFGNGDNRIDLQYEGYLNYEYLVAGTYVVRLKGISSGQCNSEYVDTIVVLPACPLTYDTGGKIAEGCEDLTVEFYDNVYYVDNELNTKWYFFDKDEDQIPEGLNETDISSYDDDPNFEYTEPGIYHPYFIAWNDACGSENQPYLVRRDTVVVYTKPIIDFDVAPNLIMLPDQLLTCFNYTEYGDRYYWDFGDGTSGDNSLEFPQHLYSEPGIYDISLSVWTEHECFDQKTLQDAVTVQEEGAIEFPDAFTPNLSGGNGGTYPCGEKYKVDKENLNDVFYPKQSGVVSFKLEIYNRWGEKIFISDDLCKGWDGYVDGVLAPQDVYVWKVSVIYRNGKPDKKYGSVTLLR